MPLLLLKSLKGGFTCMMCTPVTLDGKKENILVLNDVLLMFVVCFQQQKLDVAQVL